MIMLWVLSAALLLLRLTFIGTTMVIDDEAYYLMYARHLDWGYIDHGPVVGWLIRVFTTIFGENGFGIRIVGVLMITVLGLALYRFGRWHFSSTTGAALSLTVVANMLTHTNSIIVTPDAPMAFFCILAIMAYYRAFFADRRYFALAGLLLGLAMLSKISAVFPAIGIALFPVVSREHHRHLRDVRFYVSFLIALLVLTPFLIWNLQNDLAFFRYQGTHVARSGSVISFLELWAGLAILTGPVFFGYAIAVPFESVAKRRVTESWRLYFSLTAAVPLAYFIAHSLFSRMELNWPAPALFGGLFLFGVAVGESWERCKRRFWVQIGYSLVIILVTTAHTYSAFLPIRTKNDITNRYYAYTAFREDLTGFLAENPDLGSLRIVANNYQIPSMVNLYQSPEKTAVCLSIGYHDTMYKFYYPDDALVGEDFLVIEPGEAFPVTFEPLFDSVERVGTLESKRGGRTVMSYGLWRANGYEGK